ncbi:4-hydroxy-tetrahydrodipicolinate synthase [Micropruina sp.]|uniref:4-hydroxy-tetrahydrodipicolinate synthase n=1 Tax=Micropruina sp. TaxID=2737536 RepID=UPI0039E65D28
MPQPTFGRMLTAMVTPFRPDGSVDVAQARKLAAYLVDEQLNDALVINGTTGESPTTSDAEKADLVAAVVAEVGDRAKVLAGVGTNETAHTVRLAKQAEQAGANGLLVVTPYYSKPPQDALAAHFRAVADATELPVMLYDIPHRAAVPIQTATMIELAAHPRIVAVKDAKGDLVASAAAIASTELHYYSGDDALTLPVLSVGGVGVVGTSTHFTGARTKAMIETFLAGDLSGAIAANAALLPVFTGVFATQGCMLVKAGLAARGFGPAVLRLPMLPASSAEASAFVALLDAAGL